MTKKPILLLIVTLVCNQIMAGNKPGKSKKPANAQQAPAQQSGPSGNVRILMSSKPLSQLNRQQVQQILLSQDPVVVFHDDSPRSGFRAPRNSVVHHDGASLSQSLNGQVATDDENQMSLPGMISEERKAVYLPQSAMPQALVDDSPQVGGRSAVFRPRFGSNVPPAHEASLEKMNNVECTQTLQTTFNQLNQTHSVDISPSSVGLIAQYCAALTVFSQIK